MKETKKMIDKVKIASKNWADEYIQKHGNQVTKLLQCAYTEGFMKGVELSERKHGHWIKNDNGTYSCSKCCSWIPEEQYYYAKYCLYCGSSMDMDEVEEWMN